MGLAVALVVGVLLRVTRSEAQQPVPELAASSPELIRRLAESVARRTPLLVRGAVEPAVIRSVTDWLERPPAELARARVVPAGNTDGRSSFLDPVFAANPADASWIAELELGRLVGFLHGREADPGPCNDRTGRACDWREHSLYWRVQGGRRADGASGRLLEALNQSRTPFDRGELGQGWARQAVMSRVGSAGMFYGAHIDCSPNVLQVFTGNRTLQLLDLKEALRARPEAVDQMLVDLKQLAERGHRHGQLWTAELSPRDWLYIPCLWVHDVIYHSGSLGANGFYGSPDHADEHLCDFLKFHYLKRPDRNKTAQLRAAILLSESAAAPKEWRDYFEPLGIEPPGAARPDWGLVSRVLLALGAIGLMSATLCKLVS